MSDHQSPEIGICPTCGTGHPPELPHDEGSLSYQLAFYRREGRWANYEDASAHCTEEVRERYWLEALGRVRARSEGRADR